MSRFLRGLNINGVEPQAGDDDIPEKKSKKAKTKKLTIQEIEPKRKVTGTSAAEKKKDRPTEDHAATAVRPQPTKTEETTTDTKSTSQITTSHPADNKRIKTRFVVEPTSQWYTSYPPLPPANPPVSAPTAAQLASLTAHAADLHAETISTYQSQSSSTATTTTSDFSFLQKILQGGTLSDRLSALTLLVQSSPVHNVKALETLKGMAERGKGKGGREESLKALRCVVDWWVGGGVPNRKLK